MLGLGFTETIVLAGIILIVMGPEKFPDVAKAIIRTVRDVRGYFDEAQREITKEINPLKGELRQLSKYKPDEIIDHMTGAKTTGEPTPVKKSPVEDDAIDPDLAEPGLTGYGAKVPTPTPADATPDTPEGQSDTPDTTADQAHAQPYQPYQYNPYPENDDELESNTPESAPAPTNQNQPAQEKDELDDLNPPPRLEG